MRFGLLGESLKHSYSPEIHAAFGDDSYTLFERKPEEIASFLAEAPFDGLNVTVPYKKTVVPYLSGLSPEACRLGSVNTVLKRPDGTLFGANTDVYGFSVLLEKSGLQIRGKKALVLGSGGASASVREVLSAGGAKVVIISRSGENHYGNLDRHRDAAVLVNATPVGMYPNNGAAPLSLTHFPALEGVFDLIYNPARTALLQEAEKRGIPAFNGLAMLVAQAAKSREWFTGEPVPKEQIESVTEKMAKEKQNIVLIGMPGSGKSTIGKALSVKLGRGLADLDQAVEKKTHRTPEEILLTEGETAFRQIETEVLSEAAIQSGLVIAAGGGIVTRPENYPLLHGNGTIVWIRRDLEQLDRSGRPLSQGDLSELYRIREPLYRAFADLVIDNDRTAEDAAERIAEAL